ncbi:DNA repair protein Swi5 [Penicillium cf. griseofulvum]|uniref:DNA repair protein Swi5 n=1 Tax=Penicillium cf. griseofulvum TaxID=2972120 RepID=A0A9W9JGB2_9EURO|nr:DNA repair protein Swi5 [Penicillium cf. griseofulvum]KAJ5445065.1 DNA repair protein Swi5 [Penicillium cf. griseofulvum]KAJ5446783.1 DNA repair protein Swi5 [Penicillium cf. griseofulvum]
MDPAKEPKSYRDQQRIAALRASIANLEAKHARLETDLAALHDRLM